MEISSKSVADLRAETGVGMMDCKKALVEAGGDFEEARKILRKRGLATAARKADRATSEGLVVARVTPGAAVLVEVNCETDFVARTSDFRALAEGLSDLVAAHAAFGETRSGDPAALAQLPAPGKPTETVTEALTHLIAKLGENMGIRRFARLSPRPGERFASYVHGNGRIGVLVGLRRRRRRSRQGPRDARRGLRSAFRLPGGSHAGDARDRTGDRPGAGRPPRASPRRSSNGSPRGRSRSSTRRRS